MSDSNTCIFITPIDQQAQIPFLSTYLSFYHSQQLIYIMTLYIIEAVVVAIICCIIIWWYSHESTPFYVRTIVYLTFLVCYLGFMLVPIDVYQTSQTQQQEYVIFLLWKIAYYINFFLCWLILPIVQQYQDSGEFSFFKRLKESLIKNAIIIGVLTLGAFFIALYMMIANGFNISQIPSAFAMLANIFGLFLVSIFLGTGLITFPKEFFQKRVLKTRVNRCHLQAEAIKQQEQRILQEIYAIYKFLTKKQLQNRSSQQIIVLQLINSNFTLTNFQSYIEPTDYSNRSLSYLHQIIKRRIFQFGACQSRIDQLVDDVKGATQSFSKSNYKKQCIIYSSLFIITSIISLIVVWGEVCTFIPVLYPLNILSLLDNKTLISYIINFLLLGYIAYLVVHSVFRIKVYKMYQLHKKHSNSSSLTFTAINLSRICFPLCYNYISIIGLPKTSFLSLFGQISFPEEYTFISYIFPVLMVIFAILNLLNIYDKIMGYLGFSSYAFDEQQVAEKIEDGRNILMERLKTRSIQSNNLLEMIQLL